MQRMLLLHLPLQEPHCVGNASSRFSIKEDKIKSMCFLCLPCLPCHRQTDRLVREKERTRILKEQLSLADTQIKELRSRLKAESNETILRSGGNALEQMYECKLCMNVPIQCVFLPCGHTLSCHACSVPLQKCPVCRMEIEDTTSLHMM